MDCYTRLCVENSPCVLLDKHCGCFVFIELFWQLLVSHDWTMHVQITVPSIEESKVASPFARKRLLFNKWSK